jgi:hypothetical protein
MSGMRSRIARHQQDRGGRVTTGRDPMTLELYQKLHELALKRDERDGMFLYTLHGDDLELGLSEVISCFVTFCLSDLVISASNQFACPFPDRT